MNIVVCVKQVPASNEARMDPVTNTVIRENVESILNPFDAFAVEEAVRLKARCDGSSVMAISMGVPSAAQMLRGVIAVGVDQAMLLTDRAFAGADTWATANALASAIGILPQPDLILCGNPVNCLKSHIVSCSFILFCWIAQPYDQMHIFSPYSVFY